MVLTDRTLKVSNAGVVLGGGIPVNIQTNENSNVENQSLNSGKKRFSRIQKQKRGKNGALAPLKESSLSNIATKISPSNIAQKGAAFFTRMSPKKSVKFLPASPTPIEKLLNAEEKEAKAIEILGIVPAGKDGQLSRKQRSKVRAHLAKEEKAAGGKKKKTKKSRKSKKETTAPNLDQTMVPPSKKEEACVLPSTPKTPFSSPTEDCNKQEESSSSQEEGLVEKYLNLDAAMRSFVLATGDKGEANILELLDSVSSDEEGETFNDSAKPVEETVTTVPFSPKLEMEVLVGPERQQSVVPDPYHDDNDGKVDACAQMFLPVRLFFKNLLPAF